MTATERTVLVIVRKVQKNVLERHKMPLTNYILPITFTEISTEEPKLGISNFLTTMMTPNQGMFFIYKS